MDRKVLIRAESISKEYHMGEVTVNALQDVSFQINEGEFVVILGPSGSGKSTLLNIIGGMDNPTKGDVYLRDDKITDFNDKELTNYRRDKIGFVFQFYNLMANLTARENIELAVEICKEPLNIDEILRDVELEDRRDHFPSQLSGGEQQRVAIARAVAKNPLLLLCDEPTGALDFKTGISILSLLSKINKLYNKTVVIITHNSPIAEMGDRIIKMRSGRIIEDRLNPNPIEPERIVW